MLTTVFVFHLKEWTPSATTTSPDQFECVARIDYTGTPEAAMGAAFAATNHIDGNWATQLNTAGKETGTAFKRHPRSTSIGDILLIDEQIHRCAAFGWEKVETDQVNGFRALAESAKA